MGREHSKFEFRYDQNDQLIQTRFQGMNGMPNLNRSHQYDFAGNKIKDSKNGVGEFLGNFLLRNEDSTFVADPDGRGELTEEINGDQKKVYSYRSDGKISGYQIGNLFVTYHYDAFDRLIGKSINKDGSPFTNTFVHLGDENRVLLGKAGNGEVTKYVDGQGVADRLGEVKGNTGKGYITDHLGSVLNSSPAGSSRAYGLFGEVYANVPLNASSSPVMWGWQGLNYDAATGKWNNLARQYDQNTGTFTSQDPIGLAGGDLNLYRSRAGNSLLYTDSSGNFIDTIADVGFIGYDLYRIAKDNVFGSCDNLGENLAALGADIGGLLTPFATGGGVAVRAGLKIQKGTTSNADYFIKQFAKGDPAKAETIRRRIENANRSVGRGGKDNVVFNPKTGEIIDPKTGEVLDAVE